MSATWRIIARWWIAIAAVWMVHAGRRDGWAVILAPLTVAAVMFARTFKAGA